MQITFVSGQNQMLIHIFTGHLFDLICNDIHLHQIENI